MGIRIIRYSKNKLPKPQVVKRRSFKSFNIADFLTDIYYSNINISVKSHEDIELASEAFRNEFSAILDLHAPIKTIQLRNNYCPYLYDETKIEIANRNMLLKEALRSKDPDLMAEYKEKSKAVKKAVKEDKKRGDKINFSIKSSSKQAWAAAKRVLGSGSNSTPQSILDSNKEITTSSQEIAEIMNLHFVDKVRLLRDRSKSVPTTEPVERLRSWLRSRPGPPLPNFELKPINLITLRKLIKNMKGGTSCG